MNIYLKIYCFLNINQDFGQNTQPCMSALIQMCDQWLENMDNGMINGVVFLDIRKAFDSIDHSILLKKMNEQFGIYVAELKWSSLI